jgi:hypothetical protein
MFVVDVNLLIYAVNADEGALVPTNPNKLQTAIQVRRQSTESVSDD